MFAGITFVSYDSHWWILSLKGYFWSEHPAKEVRVSVRDKGDVGAASLGWRFIDKRFYNDRNRGFVFERRLPFSLRPGDVVEIHCFDEKGGAMVSAREFTPPADHKKLEHGLKGPDIKKGRSLFKKPDFAQLRQPAFWCSLKTAVASSLLGRTNYFRRYRMKKRLSGRENVIFVAIHNLDVEDRKVKLDCFEKINRAMQSWGWKLFVAHHSIFDLHTDMEFAQMLQVKIPPKMRSDAWLSAPGAHDALFEATTLLQGHHAGMKNFRSWDDCYGQVMREAEVFDYLMRCHRPYACLLWHQWNSLATMNAFICRYYNIPFIYAHEGFLADTLGLDLRGEMAESMPATCSEEFNTLPIGESDLGRADDYLRYLGDNNMDRKMQIDSGAVGDVVRHISERYGRPVLFYAGVNDFQTGMLPVWREGANLHSPHFVDTYDALDCLYEVCEKNDWYLIFKPHPNIPPRNASKYKDRVVELRSANIIECVKTTAVTLTLLSTMAYNARVHKRPVVLLGRNTLSDTGAIYDCRHREDIEGLIEKALAAENEGRMNDCFRNHVARLLRYYLYPYSEASTRMMGKKHADAARFIVKQCRPGSF